MIDMTKVNQDSWNPYKVSANNQAAYQTPQAGTTTAQANPWANVSSYFPQYGQSQAFSNYPSQWGTASNTLTGFANGQYNTNVPTQWNQATDFSNQMMQTGMPTNTSAAYEAAKASGQYDVQNAIKQAAEQAGLGGMRYSSPMAAQAQNISGQYATNLANQYAQQAMSAEEAARQRQLSAASQMYQLGGGTAGLTQQNALNALTAAGGLGSLGGQYAQLPMTAAQTASNMGSNLYGQYSQLPNAYYQNWAAQQGYNNPWLQQAGQFTQNNTMVPQQYSPGVGSQMLGFLGGLAGPAAYLLGG